MGYHTKPKKRKYKEEFSNKETVEEVKEYPIKAIPERGLKKSTCKYFGIRVGISEVDGETIEAIYFPYYTGKQLTGYKKKDLTVAKNDDFHFTTIGKVSSKCDLFGSHKVPKSGKKIFTVEGELDVATTWQILYERSDYKGKKHIPAVVGIGGTSWAAVQVSNSMSLYKNFTENVFLFDQDEANFFEKKDGVKKGKEALQDVAKLIPNMLVATISENDPNDMLIEGKAEELYWALVAKARAYVPHTLVEGSVGLEKLMKPLEHGVYVDCFPKTMNMLRGFRKSEMTVILAPAGVGKTTITKEIGYALNCAGESIFHIFLEEDLEKTQQSYVALDNNVMLNRLRENPKLISEENWKKSEQKLLDNGRTLWMDHFGSVNPEVLMDDVRWAEANHYDYILLDHISMVFSGLKTSNERKDIDLLLTELAAFTKGGAVHPIVITHIKREQKVKKKDRDGNIEYPYWDNVALDAARGSAIFEQTAWNIIAIEPEIKEDGTRGRVRLRVLKNREWSTLGITDILKMDENTGRMVTAEEDLSSAF